MLLLAELVVLPVVAAQLLLAGLVLLPVAEVQLLLEVAESPGGQPEVLPQPVAEAVPGVLLAALHPQGAVDAVLRRQDVVVAALHPQGAADAVLHHQDVVDVVPHLQGAVREALHPQDAAGAAQLLQEEVVVLAVRPLAVAEEPGALRQVAAAVLVDEALQVLLAAAVLRAGGQLPVRERQPLVLRAGDVPRLHGAGRALRVQRALPARFRKAPALVSHVHAARRIARRSMRKLPT